MKPTYTPRTDSLASRVIAFFQRNPEEELDLDAITDKFDATRGNIHTQLGSAIDAGMLVRDRNSDGDYIYKAGKKLPAPQGSGVDMDAVHRRSPFPPMRSAGRHTTTLPDLDQIDIEDNVPIPSGRGVAKRDWMPLLKRLQPRQSVKLLAARYSLSSAITEAHKAQLGTFTMRTFKDAQELRIWRTA